MRKMFIFGIAALALACSNSEHTGPSSVPTTLPRPLSRVTLSGTISSAADGRPIEKVRVQVVGTDRFVYSDEAGRYSLAELEPGTLNVQFIAGEYVDLQRTEVVEVDKRLDVKLERKGLTLSGTITTQWGEPINDVGVEALLDGRVAGGASGMGFGPGTYRIPTLAPGNYVVRTIKFGYVDQKLPVTMTGDTTLNFVLDRVRVTIFGSVSEAAPCTGAIVDARVEIVSGPDAGTGASSTSSGYQLKNVNWGKFTLRTTKAGYQAAEVSMDVRSPGSSNDCQSCPYPTAPVDLRQDLQLQRTGGCCPKGGRGGRMFAAEGPASHNGHSVNLRPC